MEAPLCIDMDAGAEAGLRIRGSQNMVILD
jgi:hypothetical protein